MTIINKNWNYIYNFRINILRLFFEIIYKDSLFLIIMLKKVVYNIIEPLDVYYIE